MNFMPLVHFSSFLIYGYLAVFVLIKNPRSSVNRVCSLFLCCGAIWSFAFIYVHNTEVSKKTAELFMNISSIGWINFSFVFLWFVLLFIGEKNTAKKNILLLLTLVPALYLNYRQWVRPFTGDLNRVSFGWLSFWTDTSANMYFVYYFLVMSIAVLLMLEFRKRTGKKSEKRQTTIIVTSLVIPVMLGTMVNVIFPMFRITVFPAIADVITILCGVGMIYVMITYKYLEMTPGTAAGNILSTMADSFVLIGNDFRILDVNKYTEQLLEYNKKDLTGLMFDDLFVREKDKVPLERRNLIRLLKHGSIKDYSAIYRTRKGEHIPVSFSASIIRNRDKIMVGIVCIARDMRKMMGLVEKEKELAAEKAAKEAETKKALELKKAYTSLKDAQNMLIQSEKFRELGELGAGVVHELNNPLTGILSLLRSYRRKYPVGTVEYDDLVEMEKGLQFMAGIVRGLADFTRESSGGFINVNCNTIVNSILGFLTPQLEGRNIRLIKELEEDLPEIYGNRHQIQQVVVNIISNAIDAMPCGGTLTASTRSVHNNAGDHVEMEFIDTGCGISPSDREKLFEPFFTTKCPGGGVGLGLSIVHSIIRFHNGKISVKSKEGKGSIFTISLSTAHGSGNVTGYTL